jgi:hypothetical protein
MSDTPIIDACISAAISDRLDGISAVVLAALRAALPVKLPAERLETIIKAGCLGGRANCRYPSCGCETSPETVIAAYDNDPIMLELYRENGTPR